MARIAKITRAYVRKYRDNGQSSAYVEWVDDRGNAGRTEGPIKAETGTLARVYGLHMGALMARAICTGIEIEREIW